MDWSLRSGVVLSFSGPEVCSSWMLFSPFVSSTSPSYPASTYWGSVGTREESESEFFLLYLSFRKFCFIFGLVSLKTDTNPMISKRNSAFLYKNHNSQNRLSPSAGFLSLFIAEGVVVSFLSISDMTSSIISESAVFPWHFSSISNCRLSLDCRASRSLEENGILVVAGYVSCYTMNKRT